MEAKRTYFVHESHIPNVRPLRKDKTDYVKSNFLKEFINELGKASLHQKSSPAVRIPIQAVVREEVDIGRKDFSKIFPEPQIKPVTKSAYYTEKIPKIEVPKVIKKRLPYLPPKVKPKEIVKVKPQTIKVKPVKKVEKKKAIPAFNRNVDLSLLKKRVYQKDGKLYYRPIEKGYEKKYGEIDPLIFDRNIIRITCFDYVLKVDNGYKKGLLTEIKFKKSKEVNRIMKKLAEDAGVVISEEEPLLDARIYEGFRVHGNYGTDFIEPSFEMVRLKNR